VPDRRSIFRLLALAGFLLTVALALWLAELRPLFVVIVMAAALLVAWATEWLSWRQDVLRLAAENAALEEEAGVPPPPPVQPSFEPEPEPAPVTPEPQVAEPEPVAEPAPVVEPEPVAPEPEPEPAPAPPAPEPRPPLRPVPPPAPVPPAPQPRPVQPAPAASGVVDMRTRVTAQPRRWNLWDLERRARDEAQRDPARYEEWSYLFVHLRQFATPDGSLPTEFDGLVRESFGELLEHAG
jgi:outer membrane biosynthesis protein TonB